MPIVKSDIEQNKLIEKFNQLAKKDESLIKIKNKFLEEYQGSITQEQLEEFITEVEKKQNEDITDVFLNNLLTDVNSKHKTLFTKLIKANQNNKKDFKNTIYEIYKNLPGIDENLLEKIKNNEITPKTEQIKKILAFKGDDKFKKDYNGDLLKDDDNNLIFNEDYLNLTSLKNYHTSKWNFKEGNRQKVKYNNLITDEKDKFSKEVDKTLNEKLQELQSNYKKINNDTIENDKNYNDKNFFNLFRDSLEMKNINQNHNFKEIYNNPTIKKYLIDSENYYRDNLQKLYKKINFLKQKQTSNKIGLESKLEDYFQNNFIKNKNTKTKDEIDKDFSNLVFDKKNLNQAIKDIYNLQNPKQKINNIFDLNKIYQERLSKTQRDTIYNNFITDNNLTEEGNEELLAEYKPNDINNSIFKNKQKTESYTNINKKIKDRMHDKNTSKKLKKSLINLNNKFLKVQQNIAQKDMQGNEMQPIKTKLISKDQAKQLLESTVDKGANYYKDFITAKEYYNSLVADDKGKSKAKEDLDAKLAVMNAHIIKNQNTKQEIEKERIQFEDLNTKNGHKKNDSINKDILPKYQTQELIIDDNLKKLKNYNNAALNKIEEQLKYINDQESEAEKKFNFDNQQSNYKTVIQNFINNFQKYPTLDKLIEPYMSSYEFRKNKLAKLENDKLKFINQNSKYNQMTNFISKRDYKDNKNDIELTKSYLQNDDALNIDKTIKNSNKFFNKIKIYKNNKKNFNILKQNSINEYKQANSKNMNEFVETEVKKLNDYSNSGYEQAKQNYLKNNIIDIHRKFKTNINTKKNYLNDKDYKKANEQTNVNSKNFKLDKYI